MAAYERRVVYFSTILFVLFYEQTYVLGAPPYDKIDLSSNRLDPKEGYVQKKQLLRNFPPKPKEYIPVANSNSETRMGANQFEGLKRRSDTGLNNQVKQFGQPQIHNPVKQIKIADSPECAEDVQRFCSRGIRGNNFAILNCLQSGLKVCKKISVCHTSQYNESLH